MTTEKKYDLKWSRTKTSILEFILKNGPVSEPSIRENINKPDKGVSQGTVNRHLHDLKELDYVELIPPAKKGLFNKWDITKINQLKNIKSRCSELSLNKYEKPFWIILKECGEDRISLQGLKIYTLLLLSVSLFEECIDSGIEALLSRAWQVYLCDEGSKNHWEIKKLTSSFYELYIKNGIDVEISKEGFLETIEKLDPNMDEISVKIFLRKFEERFPRLSKEMSLETFLEIEEKANKLSKGRSQFLYVPNEMLYRMEGKSTFLQTEKEITFDKGKGIAIHLTAKESNEKYVEIICEEMCKRKFRDWSKDKEVPFETILENMNKDRKMYKTLTEILVLMRNQQETFKSSCFNLLLKHFCKHDILTGVSSPEELEFLIKIAENYEIHRDLLKARDYKGSTIMELYGDLQPISKVIVKYKKPSIFYVSDNSDDVYKNLKEFFCPDVESHVLEAGFRP